MGGECGGEGRRCFLSSSSRLSPEQLSDARTGRSTVIYSGGVRDEGVMRDGEGRGRSDERWGGKGEE